MCGSLFFAYISSKDKVKLQIQPTAKNNKSEQSLEQDSHQAVNTGVNADTENLLQRSRKRRYNT